RYLDVANGKRVVDQAFAVFFVGAGSLHLLLRNPYPGDRTFTLQHRKRSAQQAELCGGISEIEVAGTINRVRASHYQFACQLKGMSVGAFERKGPGIGKHGGVKAGCNLRSHFASSRATQPIDEFSRRHRGWVNPVDVGKVFAAFVVINVDQELLFQAFKPGALDVIAFKKNGGVVPSGDAITFGNPIGEWEVLINARHTVVQNDINLLAQLAQKLAAGQG